MCNLASDLWRRTVDLKSWSRVKGFGKGNDWDPIERFGVEFKVAPKKKKTLSRTFSSPSTDESRSPVTSTIMVSRAGAVVHDNTGLIDSSSALGELRSPHTTGVDVAKLKLLVEAPG